MNNKNSIISRVLEVEQKLGTRVATFVYNNRKRNVIIGANTLGSSTKPYSVGNHVSRSLVVGRATGKIYLVPRVMNEDSSYKAFDLSKITNFRCP